MPLVGHSRYLADPPGRWKPWMFNAYGDVVRVHGAKPAEVKDVEAQLLRLQAIIKKTDGFTNPVGFSIGTFGSLGLASGRLSEIPGEPSLNRRWRLVSLAFPPRPGRWLRRARARELGVVQQGPPTVGATGAVHSGLRAVSRPGAEGPHVGGCVANKRLLESIDTTALLAWLR